MKFLLSCFLLLSALSACSQTPSENKKIKKPTFSEDTLQTAYFAAGCFWCVEAIFESIDGVQEVVSGYSGGKEENPTYELICTGRTKHAETVKIIYDQEQVPYDTLLVAFFNSHDPSTLNSQGPDFGPQYRSVIFFKNEQEKLKAENYIKKLLAEKIFPKITTELTPLTAFYEAEIYHQDYEKNNPDNPYIQRVSIPRLTKFKTTFKGKLKD